MSENKQMKQFMLLNMIMLIAYNYAKIHSVFQMVPKHFNITDKCMIKNGKIDEISLDDVVLVELAVAAEGFLEIGDGHELDEGGAVAVAAAVRDELDAVVFDLDALEEGADVFVGGVVFEVFDFDYGVEFVHGRFGPVVVGVGVVEVIVVFVGVGREGFFVLHAVVVVVVVVGVVEFALVGREVVVLVGLVVFG